MLLCFIYSFTFILPVFHLLLWCGVLRRVVALSVITYTRLFFLVRLFINFPVFLPPFTVLCGVGSVVILGLVWVMTRRSAPKPGLLHLFTGKYLHPQRCSTTFQWEDPAPVGNTVSFTVQVCSAFFFSSYLCLPLCCTPLASFCFM